MRLQLSAEPVSEGEAQHITLLHSQPRLHTTSCHRPAAPLQLGHQAIEEEEFVLGQSHHSVLDCGSVCVFAARCHTCDLRALCVYIRRVGFLSSWVAPVAVAQPLRRS